MALTKEQIYTIEKGDKLKRNGGGTSEVYDVIKASNGNVAVVVDATWDNDKTVILDTYGIQDRFTAIM
jgi:hypothetical protein